MHFRDPTQMLFPTLSINTGTDGLLPELSPLVFFIKYEFGFIVFCFAGVVLTVLVDLRGFGKSVPSQIWVRFCCVVLLG